MDIERQLQECLEITLDLRQRVLGLEARLTEAERLLKLLDRRVWYEAASRILDLEQDVRDLRDAGDKDDREVEDRGRFPKEQRRGLGR